MYHRNYIIIILIIVLTIGATKGLRLKLTNLVCQTRDSTYFTFKNCKVKAVSRDVQYITLYINFLKVPVTDINVRFRFMKRANGYKPFLYEFKFECDFTKRLNLVSGLVWRWIKEVSNLNHSCPFTHDFEIKRLENRYLAKQLNVLPLVDGDYGLFVNFKIGNSSKFDLEFYAEITA